MLQDLYGQEPCGFPVSQWLQPVQSSRCFLSDAACACFFSRASLFRIFSAALRFVSRSRAAAFAFSSAALLAVRERDGVRGEERGLLCVLGLEWPASKVAMGIAGRAVPVWGCAARLRGEGKEGGFASVPLFLGLLGCRPALRPRFCLWVTSVKPCSSADVSGFAAAVCAGRPFDGV